MNIEDAVKHLADIERDETGVRKIALVVTITFVKKVLKSRGAVLELHKALSPETNLNQQSLFGGDDG